MIVLFCLYNYRLSLCKYLLPCPSDTPLQSGICDSCQHFLQSAASSCQIFWYAWHYSWHGMHRLYKQWRRNITSTGLRHDGRKNGVLTWEFRNGRKICVGIVMVDYSSRWAQHSWVRKSFTWRERGRNLQNQWIRILYIRDASMAGWNANCIRGTDNRWVSAVHLRRWHWNIYLTAETILEHFSHVTWVTTFGLR